MYNEDSNRRKSKIVPCRAVQSNNSAEVASIAFITWSGIEETELGITSCCSPVVVSSSTKFSRQVASCRDNIQTRLSLSQGQENWGRGISIRQTSKSRELGPKLWIRFGVEPLQSGFLPLFRRKWTRSAPRGSYSQNLRYTSLKNSLRSYL